MAYMAKTLKAHVRLLALTGLAVGLSIIFLTSPSAESKTKNLQPDAAAPEIVTKEKPFEFPHGGRILLPDYRLIALYGTPDIPVLGSLGEQDVAAAINRVKQLAAEHQGYSDEPVYPAFEIITTIASAQPTENGDYSSEISIEKLQPWIDAAKQAGIYVVLDLQPGYTDFLTQAKQYEALLREPHVGLALDSEWRLAPGQRHMKQIGSVSADEINQTAEWLAGLVKKYDLPQKLFLLHQFKLSMITDRETLDTSRPELAWLIQMDGLGAQPAKQDTWRTIRSNAPKNVYFGWKNFIDEDTPMLTPKQTMLIDPKPYFVSYQ